MEIYKMLVLSTSHVSKETAKLLDRDNVGVVVYPKSEYGWFIVATDWDEHENIPDDLQKCLELTEQLGCDWLCLDCDGKCVPELLTYKW